jgi:rSAM/selenodomain-associated transferase 2
MISAIIVTFNEEQFIHSIIDELEKQLQVEYEIILADGGSTDQTIDLARQRGIEIISCRKGKSCQMNDAAKKATGDILFFVHADMELSKNTLFELQQHIGKGFEGGGFANVFDEHNEKIKRIGNWLNFRFFDKREQSDKGIFYGDNGIFVKKKVFEKLDGFKEIPIMEDYDFSKRLSHQFNTIKIRNPFITVSARRHAKAGFWKTRIQWVLIRILFKWGVSPKLLAKWYADVR